MRKLLIAMLLLATPAFASVSIKRSVEKPATVNIDVVDEPLSSAIKALKPFLRHRVQMVVSDERTLTYKARNVAPDEALTNIVAAAGATLTFEKDQFWIRNDPDPKVSIDVKDQDIRTILKTMQKQCGVKNLVIDPDVQGKGTFLFNDVPCRTAFDVVFRTMSLASVDYGNSVVTVGGRRR